jgi:hypothetical protein
MEMQIGGRRCHGAAHARVAALICVRVRVTVDCRHGRAVGNRQLVLQAQNKKVAGLQSQIGRLIAVPVDVAVASGSVGLGRVANR